jgi:carbon-monoxide dehydrogenase medium subunit
MKNVHKYLYPTDVTEALVSLNENENSAFVAGGTHLTSGTGLNTQCLIDITQLGLNEIIDKDKSVNVGATTTITEMYEAPLIAEIGNGVLKKACQLIGDTPLRNKITLGGNIARLYPWVGLPVVLLTLDAEIIIQKQDKTQYRVSAVEHFSKGGVPTGELILGVEFPKKANWFHNYEKFVLTKVDYTWLTIAFATKVQDGKIINSRVAVSRITKAKRISAVEAMLKDQTLINLDIDKAAQTLQQEIEILQDYRSSKEYRTHLLGVLFKRMLQQLQEES